ncbi:unnamed protein product [Didymodactylos carnosus]|uniref:Uncharacterized protein n=1 Tax=Didymodactylos carnosus TaxID=1234261 RepID=A0A815QMZ7_9BILA|nr:unnamed protein product [Didymodactylos carnosus]CAF1522893.1 unnamed protein product [Didymodactylos carnosus]CAF4309680.1 unnamed protein product [Didymodactylos carnosus]CAF4334725.1 unnamed protein product [Didymodactylos carnosus]
MNATTVKFYDPNQQHAGIKRRFIDTYIYHTLNEFVLSIIQQPQQKTYVFLCCDNVNEVLNVIHDLHQILSVYVCQCDRHSPYQPLNLSFQELKNVEHPNITDKNQLKAQLCLVNLSICTLDGNIMGIQRYNRKFRKYMRQATFNPAESREEREPVSDGSAGSDIGEEERGN